MRARWPGGKYERMSAVSATLKFHGHGCFSMAAEGKRVLIDPFISGNPLAVEKPDEIECDAVLVTHAHEDHLGDSIEIAIANDAVLVATYELANWCQRQGVADVFPMHIGGGHEFEFGHVKLTVAQHSSSIVTDDVIQGISNACGFLLTMGGKVFYYPGDTALCADIEMIGRLNEIDVTTLPIGDVFTMGMDDAVIAAEMLGAKLTIPMHYDTFDVIAADPEEYVERLLEKGMNARVMNPGEETEV